MFTLTLSELILPLSGPEGPASQSFMVFATEHGGDPSLELGKTLAGETAGCCPDILYGGLLLCFLNHNC